MCFNDGSATDTSLVQISPALTGSNVQMRDMTPYPLMSRSGSQSCHCIYPSLSSSAKITLSVWDAEITGVRWHKLSEILTSSGNITILSGSNLHNISQQWLALFTGDQFVYSHLSGMLSDPEEIFYSVHPLIGPLTYSLCVPNSWASNSEINICQVRISFHSVTVYELL